MKLRSVDAGEVEENKTLNQFELWLGWEAENIISVRFDEQFGS